MILLIYFYGYYEHMTDIERRPIIGYSRVNYTRDNKATKDMSLTYVYGGHVSKETTQEPPGLSSLP